MLLAHRHMISRKENKKFEKRKIGTLCITPDEIADAASVPPHSHNMERYPRSWKYSITSLGFRISNSTTSTPLDASNFWKLLLAPLCVTTMVDTSEMSQRFASSGRLNVCVITIRMGVCPPPCLAVKRGSNSNNKLIPHNQQKNYKVKK